MIGFIDGHKKFCAAMFASVLALVGFLNGLTVAQIAVIIGPLTTFILGQGLADFGKERAKIEKVRTWEEQKNP